MARDTDGRKQISRPQNCKVRNVDIGANEIIFGIHFSLAPRALRITIFASSAISAGAVSEGLTATQRSRAEDGVLAVHARGCIRVTNVAARAIARPAAAIVPTARHPARRCHQSSLDCGFAARPPTRRQPRPKREYFCRKTGCCTSSVSPVVMAPISMPSASRSALHSAPESGLDRRPPRDA